MDESAFALPESLTCGPFPGPGTGPTAGGAKRTFHNPLNDIRMMLPHQEPARDAAYDGHVHRHGRRFSTRSERNVRHAAFHHNTRFVHAHNRRHSSYKLTVNRFADYTDEELASLRMPRRDRPASNFATATHRRSGLRIPENLDWRNLGAVTPVKDQATCGALASRTPTRARKFMRARAGACMPCHASRLTGALAARRRLVLDLWPDGHDGGHVLPEDGQAGEAEPPGHCGLHVVHRFQRLRWRYARMANPLAACRPARADVRTAVPQARTSAARRGCCRTVVACPRRRHTPTLAKMACAATTRRRPSRPCRSRAT